MITLRDYQRDAIERARAAWREGARAPLIVAPTGAGKTVIAAELTRAHLARSDAHRVGIIVPRTDLITQTRRTLRAHGVSTARVWIDTVQALLDDRRRPPATLLIPDEAHHYVSREWGRVVQSYTCPRVGLTATPCRGDGIGLREAFDALVISASIRELTERGHLVPCRVIAPPDSGALAEDPVAAYRAHAQGRRTLIFARDIEHAEKIARELDAPVVHSNMSDEEREHVIQAFSAGKHAVLVNVNILTEGFDDPTTECVIMARGCGHVGAYLQIVGRALRPSPSTGKTDALLVDLCGVVHEHGMPDDAREYSLDGKAIRDKEDVESLRQCPACGAVWRSAEGRTCIACAFVLPAREAPEIRRRRLDEISRAHTPEQREGYRAYLENLARAKGYNPRWVHHRMRARYARGA